MTENDEVEEYLRAVAGPSRTAAVKAARGLRWISEADGAALYGYRGQLIGEAMRTTEMRVLWNLILVLGRLPLRVKERAAVVDWLFERLGDEGGLVRTMALQALFDLSASDQHLRNRVIPFAERFLERGTPAMRIRARNLLGQPRVSSE